jgi:hypothetical protein
MEKRSNKELEEGGYYWHEGWHERLWFTDRGNL